MCQPGHPGVGGLLSLNYRYPKQDFAGAMNYVLASKAPGDVVGFAGTSDHPYPPFMGRTGRPWRLRRMSRPAGARPDVAHLHVPRYLEVGSPDVAGIVERDCRERAVFMGTVGGGDMIICTLDPA
jgi:hypothetical protein